MERLHRAVEAARGQLQAIKDRLSREVGLPHAYIFDAHLLMLEDPLLLDQTEATIREEHVNAEWALRTVSEQLHALFGQFTDAYLRERSTDLDDVLGRVRLNLAGSAGTLDLSRLPGQFVVVANALSPSQAAELDWEQVLAVATDAGSSTYHTAIIARSLGIPAVVGLKDATARIPPGALVVVDGSRGKVVWSSLLVRPSPASARPRNRTAARNVDDKGRARCRRSPWTRSRCGSGERRVRGGSGHGLASYGAEGDRPLPLGVPPGAIGAAGPRRTSRLTSTDVWPTRWPRIP